METWEEFNEESEFEKDDEEANLGLMATTTSYVESQSDSYDDDEIFSKLTHEELVDSVKELAGRCLSKAKELRILKKKIYLLDNRGKFNEKQNEILLIRNNVMKNGGTNDPRTADQVLRRQYDLVVEEAQTFRDHMNDLESKTKVLEKASAIKVNKGSGKTLTKHELGLQKFLASSMKEARKLLLFME